MAQEVPIDVLEDAGFFPNDERHFAEPLEADEGKNELGVTIRTGEANMESPPGTLTQIYVLAERELIGMFRDWTVPFTRGAITIFLSVFIGMIFYGVGGADKSNALNIRSQFGSVVIILIVAQMTAVQIALFTFPDERPIFLREYSTKHYSVFAYIISHLASEL